MATRTMSIRIANAFTTTTRRACSSSTSPYLVAPCLAGPSSCPAPRPAHRQRQPLATPPPRRRYATKANNSDGDDDDQSIRAQWAKDLIAHRSNLTVSKSRRETLHKPIFDVTFTRSSGAGGQHVNKVSTKANVRVSLAAASAPNAAGGSSTSPFPLPVPREVVKIVAKESPYYVSSSHSLLITSSQSRSQEANLEDAIEKLCTHLHTLATSDLVGETSPEQREKVRRLEEREKGRTKAAKQKRAGVKQGRAKVMSWD